MLKFLASINPAPVVCEIDFYDAEPLSAYTNIFKSLESNTFKVATEPHRKLGDFATHCFSVKVSAVEIQNAPVQLPHPYIVLRFGSKTYRMIREHLPEGCSLKVYPYEEFDLSMYSFSGAAECELLCHLFQNPEGLEATDIYNNLSPDFCLSNFFLLLDALSCKRWIQKISMFLFNCALTGKLSLVTGILVKCGTSTNFLFRDFIKIMGIVLVHVFEKVLRSDTALGELNIRINNKEVFKPPFAFFHTHLWDFVTKNVAASAELVDLGGEIRITTKQRVIKDMVQYLCPNNDWEAKRAKYVVNLINAGYYNNSDKMATFMAGITRPANKARIAAALSTARPKVTAPKSHRLAAIQTLRAIKLGEFYTRFLPNFSF